MSVLCDHTLFYQDVLCPALPAARSAAAGADPPPCGRLLCLSSACADGCIAAIQTLRCSNAMESALLPNEHAWHQTVRCTQHVETQHQMKDFVHFFADGFHARGLKVHGKPDATRSSTPKPHLLRPDSFNSQADGVHFCIHDGLYAQRAQPCHIQSMPLLAAEHMQKWALQAHACLGMPCS